MADADFYNTKLLKINNKSKNIKSRTFAQDRLRKLQQKLQDEQNQSLKIKTSTLTTSKKKLDSDIIVDKKEVEPKPCSRDQSTAAWLLEKISNNVQAMKTKIQKSFNLNQTKKENVLILKDEPTKYKSFLSTFEKNKLASEVVYKHSSKIDKRLKKYSIPKNLDESSKNSISKKGRLKSESTECIEKTRPNTCDFLNDIRDTPIKTNAIKRSIAVENIQSKKRKYSDNSKPIIQNDSNCTLTEKDPVVKGTVNLSTSYASKSSQGTLADRRITNANPSTSRSRYDIFQSTNVKSDAAFSNFDSIRKSSANVSHSSQGTLADTDRRTTNTNSRTPRSRYDIYQSTNVKSDTASSYFNTPLSRKFSANDRLANIRKKLENEKQFIELPDFNESTNQSTNDDVVPMEVDNDIIVANINEIRLIPENSQDFNQGNMESYDTINSNLMRLSAEHENSSIYLKNYLYVVVDTNVFIKDLTFLHDILKSKFCDTQGTILYIPYIVLQELDKLKMRTHEAITVRAGRAIRYLNKNFEARNKHFKGQTALEAKNRLIDIESADDNILNCCFQLRQNNVMHLLLSNDVNLRNKAVCSNIICSTKDDLESKTKLNLLTLKGQPL